MTALVDWIQMLVAHRTSCWVSNMSETLRDIGGEVATIWAQRPQCLHLCLRFCLCVSVSGPLSFASAFVECNRSRAAL